MSDWDLPSDSKTDMSVGESSDVGLSEEGISAIQGEYQDLAVEQPRSPDKMNISQAEAEKALALRQAEQALREGDHDNAEQQLKIAENADRVCTILKLQQMQEEESTKKIDIPSSVADDAQAETDVVPSQEKEGSHYRSALGEAGIAERIESGAEKQEKRIFRGNPERRGF